MHLSAKNSIPEVTKFLERKVAEIWKSISWIGRDGDRFICADCVHRRRVFSFGR
jgi:hypothetical protein